MTLSVVIPTYNRRHVLGTAIDSALSQQGCGPVEVVVSDDRSTDGTTDWLATTYAGRPVRVLTNQGMKGPAGGRNTGIRAARGELVALLDSDDAFLPGHLAAAADVLRRFPDVDVVFGRARYERNGVPEDYMGPNFDRKLAAAPTVHRDDQVVVFGDGFFSHLLAYGCWFNLSTVVMRASAARELMNEQLRISEDYEFWVRLSRRHRFACLLQPQIRYTLHDENISFEADHQAAGHAPRLIQALQVMRGYPGMAASDLALIDRQMADILFDWAWRCRQAGNWRQAAGLHWQSLRRGRLLDNLLALAKLPLLALRRGSGPGTMAGQG
jgi:glycosyltransferase involved in cell wall biosynthesis